MKSPAKSFKWIFFRIICYIQIAVAVFIVALIVVGYMTSNAFTLNDILYFILWTLVFCIFITNSLSNLYLVEKLFSCRLAPRTASRFNLVMYVFFIIFSSILIIAAIVSFFQTIDSENSGEVFPLTAKIFFGLLAATSIPVWFLQIHLRRSLKRYHYAALDQFLETENP